MSLEDCLRKAGKALNKRDADAILEYVAGGMTEEDAVDARLRDVETDLQRTLDLANEQAGGGYASGIFANLGEEGDQTILTQRRRRPNTDLGTFRGFKDSRGFLTVYGDPQIVRSMLPEGVRGRVTRHGLVFTPNHSHRVTAALRGEGTTYSRGGQVTRHQKKNGRYVGAPKAGDTAAKLRKWRRTMKQLALEGTAGRFWYENSGTAILEMTGGDLAEAKKFIALLAIYSPQAAVPSNSTFALRAWAQYKAGEPISVKTRVLDTAATEVLYEGKPWGGEKTNNFYINLLREVDPTAGEQGATIDLWMMRAGQYDHGAPTDSEYAFMENETNRLAAELGWEPQQVQAAIWVAMKARMENQGVKDSTEEYSKKRRWITYKVTEREVEVTETTNTGEFAFKGVNLGIDPEIVISERSLVATKPRDGRARAAVMPLTDEQKQAVRDAFKVSQPDDKRKRGQLNWTYEPPEGGFDFLGEGNGVEVTFTITAKDVDGKTHTMDVPVSLQGGEGGPQVQTFKTVTKKKKERVILDSPKHTMNWIKRGLAHEVTPEDTNRAKFDFSDGVRRHMGQVSWEARPGRSTGILPGVHDAPYEQQLEFQNAIVEALSDENGNDLLANHLGLLADGSLIAPGMWEGDVSPSTQAQIGMAPKAGKAGKGLDDAQRTVLDAYSAVLGMLLHQEGVGYHKPIYNATKKTSNGLALEFGRPISASEISKLEKALQEKLKAAGVEEDNLWTIGLVSAPEGVRVISFGDKVDGEVVHFIDFPDLHKVAEEAFAEAMPDDIEAQARHFMADGAYIGNDWEENPNGEDYRERASAIGSSDVLRWAADQLAPRVQKVFEEFSEKYGWGDPGQSAFAQETLLNQSQLADQILQEPLLDDALQNMKDLAQLRGTFMTPKSGSRDFETIVRTVTRGQSVEDVNVILEVWDDANDQGPYKAHMVEWKYTDQDGNLKETYFIMAVQESTGTVWVNTMEMKSGQSAGFLAYVIAGTYAHNNRMQFVGDPEGLSEIARVRRNEHYLSLGLKFGTTDFLLPADEQRMPHTRSKKKEFTDRLLPLNWKEGDSDYNLKSLLFNSYTTILNVFPELDQAEYRDGRFYYQGRKIDDGQLRRMAEEVNARLFAKPDAKGEEALPSPVFGVRSIKRAIVTGTALQGSGVIGFGEALLRGDDAPDSLRNILYQSPQRTSLGFYSAAEKAALGIKLPEWKKEDGQAKGEIVWNKLKNVDGVKLEELEWLGLEEYLQTKDKFTRREVVEFIRGNGVRVEEVMSSAALMAEYRRQYSEWQQRREAAIRARNEWLRQNQSPQAAGQAIAPPLASAATPIEFINGPGYTVDDELGNLEFEVDESNFLLDHHNHLMTAIADRQMDLPEEFEERLRNLDSISLYRATSGTLEGREYLIANDGIHYLAYSFLDPEDPYILGVYDNIHEAEMQQAIDRNREWVDLVEPGSYSGEPVTAVPDVLLHAGFDAASTERSNASESDYQLYYDTENDLVAVYDPAGDRIIGQVRDNAGRALQDFREAYWPGDFAPQQLPALAPIEYLNNPDHTVEWETGGYALSEPRLATADEVEEVEQSAENNHGERIGFVEGQTYIEEADPNTTNDYEVKLVYDQELGSFAIVDQSGVINSWPTREEALGFLEETLADRHMEDTTPSHFHGDVEFPADVAGVFGATRGASYTGEFTDHVIYASADENNQDRYVIYLGNDTPAPYVFPTIEAADRYLRMATWPGEYSQEQIRQQEMLLANYPQIRRPSNDADDQELTLPATVAQPREDADDTWGLNVTQDEVGEAGELRGDEDMRAHLEDNIPDDEIVRVVLIFEQDAAVVIRDETAVDPGHNRVFVYNEGNLIASYDTVEAGMDAVRTIKAWQETTGDDDGPDFWDFFRDRDPLHGTEAMRPPAALPAPQNNLTPTYLTGNRVRRADDGEMQDLGYEPEEYAGNDDHRIHEYDLNGGGEIHILETPNGFFPLQYPNGFPSMMDNDAGNGALQLGSIEDAVHSVEDRRGIQLMAPTGYPMYPRDTNLPALPAPAEPGRPTLHQFFNWNAVRRVTEEELSEYPYNDLNLSGEVWLWQSDYVWDDARYEVVGNADSGFYYRLTTVDFDPDTNLRTLDDAQTAAELEYGEDSMEEMLERNEGLVANGLITGDGPGPVFVGPDGGYTPPGEWSYEEWNLAEENDEDFELEQWNFNNTLARDEVLTVIKRPFNETYSIVIAGNPRVGWISYNEFDGGGLGVNDDIEGAVRDQVRLYYDVDPGFDEVEQAGGLRLDVPQPQGFNNQVAARVAESTPPEFNEPPPQQPGSAVRYPEKVNHTPHTNYREIKLTLPDAPEKFLHGHFQEENILVFMRTTDRSGGSEFHIDELQSDWHQQGRKRGYKTPEAMERYETFESQVMEPARETVQQWMSDAGIPEEISNRGNILGLLVSGLQWRPGNFVNVNDKPTILRISKAAARFSEMERWNLYQAIRTLKEPNQVGVIGGKPEVPDAPFKKNDADTILALRRALMIAIEEGKTEFSWANAEEVVYRWGENREMYTNLYDKRIPKFIKKITGETPVQFAYDNGPYQAGERGKWVIELKPEFAERVKREGLPLFQRDEENDAPRGQIDITDPMDRIITLGEASDLSTFLHESAHAFLEMERGLAAEFGVTKMQQDLLDWLGVKNFDQITVDMHEQFAETFEAYLREGKSPSLRLRGAFARFKGWLLRLYQDLTKLGRSKLNDEARSIFDRMLATEEEIALNSADPAHAEMFDTSGDKPAGMTEEEWKKYQENAQKKKDKATEKVDRTLIDEITKRLTAEWKADRKEMEDQIRPELEKQPVYQVMKELQSVTLDIELVKQALGGEKLDIGTISKLNARKEGGSDPALVADLYGYKDNVKKMLLEVLSAKPLKQAVTERAEQEMINRHGDILNDGTIGLLVAEAMQNDFTEEQLIKEIRAVTKNEPDINRGYLKAEAARVIGGMKYKEIRPGRYYHAMVSAAQKAAKAADPADQRKYKIQQLANHYLYREATAARQKIETNIRYIRRVQKVKHDTKQVHPKYAANIKTLANMYEVRKKVEDAQADAEKLLDWYNAQVNDPNEFVHVDLLDPQLVQALALREEGALNTWVPTPITEMTVEQLQGLKDMLTHMRFTGGTLSEKSRAEFEADKAALVKSVEENGGDQRKKNPTQTLAERWKSYVRSGLLGITSLRNLTRQLDGFKETGKALQHIFQPLQDAHANMLRRQEALYEKFKEEMHGIHKIGLGNRDRREFTLASGENIELSTEERFMMAVYWGTESSREALMEGYGMTEQDVMNILRTLTQDQLQMVNATWKVNESMWPEMSGASVRLYGVSPPKIPPAPFEVNGVQLTGGHMRLFYDSVELEMASERQVGADWAKVMPSKAGSLHSRVGSGGRRVSLDRNNIVVALDEAVHFVSYAEVARRLSGLLNSREVRGAIVKHHGEEFHRMLIEAVDNLTGYRKKQDHGPRVLSAILRLGRQAATFKHLAYSIRNTVQQGSALPLASREVGHARYMKYLIKLTGDRYSGKELIGEINEMSPFMKNRATLVNRETREFMKQVDVDGQLQHAWNVFSQYGFAPQTYMDALIAYPTWMAKFDMEMEAHGDQKRAVTAADTAVSESVGSGSDLHLGGYFQTNNPEWVKAITAFGSWFNAYYNRIYRDTKGGTDFANAEAFSTIVTMPMVVGILSALVIMDFPDDDGEDDEGWLMWAFSTYASFLGGTVPILRDLVGAAFGMPVRSNYAGAITAPVGVVNEVNAALEGRQSGLKTASDIGKAVTAVVPVAGSGNIFRMVDYIDSYYQGNEEYAPNEALGIYQGLVEGKNRN